MLGRARRGEIELEVRHAPGGHRQLGQQLVDLALGETVALQRRAVEAVALALYPLAALLVVDSDQRAQRRQLGARDVRAADVVVDPRLV